jgi:hypothetical protein
MLSRHTKRPPPRQYTKLLYQTLCTLATEMEPTAETDLTTSVWEYDTTTMDTTQESTRGTTAPHNTTTRSTTPLHTGLPTTNLPTNLPISLSTSPYLTQPTTDPRRYVRRQLHHWRDHALASLPLLPPPLRTFLDAQVLELARDLKRARSQTAREHVLYDSLAHIQDHVAQHYAPASPHAPTYPHTPTSSPVPASVYALTSPHAPTSLYTNLSSPKDDGKPGYDLESPGPPTGATRKNTEAYWNTPGVAPERGGTGYPHHVPSGFPSAGSPLDSMTPPQGPYTTPTPPNLARSRHAHESGIIHQPGQERKRELFQIKFKKLLNKPPPLIPRTGPAQPYYPTLEKLPFPTAPAKPAPETYPWLTRASLLLVILSTLRLHSAA